MRPPTSPEPPPTGSRKKISDMVKEKHLYLCLILVRAWFMATGGRHINRMPELRYSFEEVIGYGER